MGSDAVDTLPSSIVTQGTLLWKLEFYYSHISTSRIRYKAHFYVRLSLGSKRPSQATVFINIVVKIMSSYSYTSKVFANGLFPTKTHYYQCYRTQNSRQSKVLSFQNVLVFYLIKRSVNSDIINQLWCSIKHCMNSMNDKNIEFCM